MSYDVSSHIERSQPMVYQIRIKGHLGPEWTKHWFGGLDVIREKGGDTLLTGPVVDQAALHGLLRKVRDLGVPLVSLRPIQEKGSVAREVEKEKEDCYAE